MTMLNLTFAEAVNGSVELPTILAFAFGVVFCSTILFVAILYPYPPPFLYTVSRIILSAAFAGVVAVIPGVMHLGLGTWLTASGALAALVLAYRFVPAALPNAENPLKVKQQRLRRIATLVAREDELSVEDINFLSTEIPSDINKQFWEYAKQSDKNAFLKFVQDLSQKLT